MLVKIYNIPQMGSYIAYARFNTKEKTERFVSQAQSTREQVIDDLFNKIKSHKLNPFA